MSGAEVSRRRDKFTGTGADRRARRYRKRRQAGHRVWRLELAEVETEELLSGLGYLPEGFTRKEADQALAAFITMLATVTRDDMRLDFLLRQTIESFESAKDSLP